MNIKQAKDQVENAIRAYLRKDRYGRYLIPSEKQRPLFIVGPSGIGKTAIVRQTASKMGIALVTYSMTHHTRQSAIGLPYIVKKNYGGREYSVSEYTMSEIIASVYDAMEETGLKEGILFLDEINCVSETLAPAMLQFLQYKVFGRHRVPDGWVVVTAGNPPEYNDSVREFDIVTLDRLKIINVEADLNVWKQYAYEKAVHGSVMAYLEVRQSDFYIFESTPEGKSFVTARGWEDLSDMIKLYELLDIPVDYDLISQYIQNKKTAKDFAVYYELYRKYSADYRVGEILSGNASQSIRSTLRRAKFTERLSLLGLLIDDISASCRELASLKTLLSELYPMLTDIRQASMSGSETSVLLGEKINLLNEKVMTLNKAGILTKEESDTLSSAREFMEDCVKAVSFGNFADEASRFQTVRNALSKKIEEKNALVKEVGVKMENMFAFLEDVFGEGQEILVAVSELTANPYSAVYIASYGCESYSKHNKELLFFEREIELASKADEISEI